MRERVISEEEVLLVFQHGVRSPEVADPGAAPRFSYRGLTGGRWVTIVPAEGGDGMVVLTVI